MHQDAGLPETGTALLAQLKAAPVITTIADVITFMEDLDAVLPANDGVKWFNLLYLLVTKAISQGPPGGGWADAEWLNRLDVVFAQLYFDALERWHTAPSTAPRAWQALFEVRYRPDVERVQFALAGMNAHINRDLPIAVVQTCTALQIVPDRSSRQYADFEAVNGILSQVEPQALQYLATGILGVVAEDLGKLGHVLSMWSIRTARDTAWTNAEILWQMRDLAAVRDHFLLVLDRMTGFAGRGLLIPVV
jgi:hypothetical protein